MPKLKLKGNLDSISLPSHSVKIQIIGWKVGLRCKGKTLQGPKITFTEMGWNPGYLCYFTKQFTSSFMMRLSASPNDNVRFLTLSAFLGPFFFFFFLGFSSSSSSSSSSDSSTGIMIWIGARMAPAFSSVWSTSSVFPKYVIGSF